MEGIWRLHREDLHNVVRRDLLHDSVEGIWRLRREDLHNVVRRAVGDGDSAGKRVNQAIGAHSGPVWPRVSSSLVNNGVGLTSGVPATIGLDAHAACWDA